jgi:hypothetical protein
MADLDWDAQRLQLNDFFPALKSAIETSALGRNGEFAAFGCSHSAWSTGGDPIAITGLLEPGAKFMTVRAFVKFQGGPVARLVDSWPAAIGRRRHLTRRFQRLQTVLSRSSPAWARGQSSFRSAAKISWAQAGHGMGTEAKSQPPGWPLLSLFAT